MKNKIKTLSKLFEIKEFEQKDIEHQINQIKNELNSEKKRLKMLEDLISDALKRFNENQKKECTDINELDLFYDYFYRVSKNIELQKRLIAEKMETLNVKHNRLLSAYREKKVYENLRDNLLEKEKKRESKLEQREVDFFVVSKWHKGGDNQK